MSLARDVAWRYLKRPTDPLMSSVGIVSMLGLVIGVMALVISMALMTGYREDLEKKLLGGNAEVFVYRTGDPDSILEQDIDRIRAVPGVREATPSILQHALVSTEQQRSGDQVMVKGVELRRAEDAPILERILGRSKTLRAEDGSDGVAIGHNLARRLGLEPGGTIVLTVPAADGKTIFPRSRSYTVVNVFETGFHEFDTRWIFIALPAAAELAGTPNPVNVIEVNTEQGSSLEGVVRAIAIATGHRHAVADWREMNSSLFSILALQQRVLFIVIGLIVFVSTFNIVSALITTIHEKRREIAILVSMGGTRAFIQRIFLWYGTMVGCAGTLIGLILGITVCQVLTRYELISFGPEIAEVYYVSSIPFITKPRDLAVITLFAVCVSMLAAVLPSLRAARLSPAEMLRHE